MEFASSGPIMELGEDGDWIFGCRESVIMILCVPTGAVEDTGRDIVEEQGTLKAGGMEEQGIWLSFCAAICCSSNNCKFARKTSMLARKIEG